MPQHIRSELINLRQIVQEREHVILSLRKRSAGARGANIGMTSEQAKAVAAKTNAAREKALGRKTTKGIDDPRRVAQFERLLAEQNDLLARHDPDPHHPCRPDNFSLDEWRSWLMGLDEGQQLLSARRVGKGCEEDGKALSEWRAANPGKGWQNAISPEDAVIALAVETEYIPHDISIVTCPDCGQSVPGSRRHGSTRVLHKCSARGTGSAAGGEHVSASDVQTGDEHDAASDSERDGDLGGNDRGDDTFAAGKRPAEYVADRLDEIMINWVGDDVGLAALAGSREDLELISIDTHECLSRASTDIAALGWAEVLPPGWQRLDLPPVIVHKSSTKEWIMANAIGMALSRSPGLPALERLEPFSKQGALKKYLTKTIDLTGVYECSKIDCSFIRPYRVALHDCINQSGQGIPSVTSARANRQSRTMRRISNVSFHDLPSKIKTWSWASFVSASNPLKIEAKLFSSSSSGSTAAASLPSSPAFGPSKIAKISNKAAPGTRTQQRAKRVADPSKEAVAAEPSAGAGRSDSINAPVGTASSSIRPTNSPDKSVDEVDGQGGAVAERPKKRLRRRSVAGH